MSKVRTAPRPVANGSSRFQHLFSPVPSSPSLTDFARHLASRREQILEDWRRASLADPRLSTSAALTRDQFRDHIPQVLEALEKKLRDLAVGDGAAPADAKIRREEAKHGLQRWQQGFRLEELMREWGVLHLCLMREFEAYAKAHPQWAISDQWAAAHELNLLIHDGVVTSTVHYAELERAEAAGRVSDLGQAVARLQDLERRRGQLLREAVHDLHGDMQSASNLAAVLGNKAIPEADRANYADRLQENMEMLGKMLTELMQLARLDAGEERRTVAPFDAARLAMDLCELNAARAAERGLYLRHSGPTPLAVNGDARKVHRLVQNLVVNALKYTEHGGVTLSWGQEPGHWWLLVEDTGPGLLSGPGAPLAKGLRDATESAREADEQAAGSSGRASNVLNQADAGNDAPLPRHQRAGEGIGLSIVKRLCDLLDASIELTSSGDSGTKVRLVFPLSYTG